MATMAPRTRGEASLDLRVEDFLDDQLQAATDLGSLPGLLTKVEAQRSQLQAQLDVATRELQEARLDSHDRRQRLREQTAAFEALQRDMDARLHAAVTSDAPAADAAIERLQAPLRRLRAVELAQSYLELLHDVEVWRADARSHLPANPKEALSSYTRLRETVGNMRGWQDATEGAAAAHLVAWVDGVTDALWGEMKQTMATEMEAILRARGWPNKVDPEGGMDEEWMSCFEKMLDLQLPEIHLSAESAVVTMLPFDAMARIFATEFRYHFLSDKPTGKPQAFGTHCLPWWMATVEKWEGFFRDNVGALLASKLRGTLAARRPVYADPGCALVASLLPVLREKVSWVLREGRKNPAYLSSLIGQLLSFDDTLLDRFGYEARDGDGGMAGEVLRDCFDQWFEAEKEFALERYRAIMAAHDAREIDHDYSSAGRTKPTFAAARIMDLLRTVTGLYEHARQPGHKIRFLVGIQVEILDQYHARLRESLEAYHSMTSTVGRTLHGMTREQLAAVEGVRGLETLCRAFGSADHVINTLKDWSNEEFFVTLWDDLQTRARRRGRNAGSLGTNGDDDEVRDKTWTTVGSSNDGGGLFDETISAYTARRKTAQDYLVGALVEAHAKAIRPYTGRVHWSTTVDVQDGSQPGATPELDELLRTIRGSFEFLARAVNTATVRRMARSVLEKIHDQLWAEVLMRQHFTMPGAAQFRRDVGVISASFDRFVPGAAASGLSSLTEALVFLTLPLEADDGGEGGWTLARASDRVFKDNTEAKAVMEELGIVDLTPQNARNILQRRVENNE